MSKKHKRSKKKTNVTTKKNNQNNPIKKETQIKITTPSINIEKEVHKKETSLQELINNSDSKEISKKEIVKKEEIKKITPPSLDKEVITKNDLPQIIASITNIKESPTEIKEHKSKSLQDKITPQKEIKQEKISVVSKPKQKLPQKEITQTKHKEKTALDEKPILKNNKPIIKSEKKVPNPQTLKEQAQPTEKTISKLYIVVILLLTIVLISLITFLVYSSTNYYQLINDNNELLQEITTTNTKITNTETNNNEINNQINELEKKLQDQIKEYNIWVNLQETIEKSLS